jgi:hypothetical protein
MGTLPQIKGVLSWVALVVWAPAGSSLALYTTSARPWQGPQEGWQTSLPMKQGQMHKALHAACGPTNLSGLP